MKLSQFLYNHPIVSYLGVTWGLILILAWLRGGISEHLLTVTMSVYFGSMITIVFFGVYAQSKTEVKNRELMGEWEKLKNIVIEKREVLNSQPEE